VTNHQHHQNQTKLKPGFFIFKKGRRKEKRKEKRKETLMSWKSALRISSPSGIHESANL